VDGLEAITTERLRGERLGPSHVDRLLALFGDPRVGATMGGTWSREIAAQHAAAVDEHWRRHGYGHWMWFERDSGEPIGRGGLAHTEFDGQPEVEVAWATMADRWGEGFATELGRAAVDVAFGTLELPDLVAFTLPANAPSRRVMEKLGFSFEKVAPYKVFGDHVLYRLTRSP
jgi:ribosomal-protein-alanine N-acetyltransferase